ncbi:alpha/beta hydrolase [Streptomyces sp. NPDC052077]|uniref:alpha/beta hydrolase n=1 Tax=Streptomyces sp. NPDC052077 TaxID=3154757 RepID=UPI00342B9F97
MTRLVRWTALATAAALLATGCGGLLGGGAGEERSSAPPSASAPPGVPGSLASQVLTWKRCGATAGGPAPGRAWQCATLRAPLDWSKPDGGTIGLSMIRSKARGGERIGSLFLNFGGPGDSGVSTLPSYEDVLSRLHQRYDLVSWDPRGVAASSGIRCRDDKALDAAGAVDSTPDTPAEEAAFLKDAADFGRGCAKAAGTLMSHVSTTDTARDMDLMRHVLGDRETRYLGFSYGTELGGVYAHLFPGRVGRLVLDAVVDPTADLVGHAENQARGFQRALDSYLESTGEDPVEGTERIADLLARLDAEPLPASSGRELTQTLALTGIALPLYSEDGWPVLTEALEAAEEGDGTELLRLADMYNERDESGRYGTMGHSQRVISCLDDRRRPTVEEARALLPEFEAISPVFGAFMAWDTAGWCHEWPVRGQRDTPEVSAPGAAPVLVVGNTGDPATPYEGARRMADGLGKGVGVLLTWEGEGHGAYGSGSDCVDSAVDAYLLEGRVPEDGRVCS